MNLKSYLRGIGIGILVTSAVFIIAGASDKKATMTDDMIKARAKELGMVEASATVADVDAGSKTEEVKPTIETVKEEGVTPSAEPAKEAEPTEEALPDPTPTPEPTEEVSPEPTPTPEPTKEPEPTQEAKADTGNAQTVSIVVNSGDGSDTVSRKLKEAGVIKDAASFDKLLISKGYDRRITTGQHNINSNDSEDEIAENLIRSTK